MSLAMLVGGAECGPSNPLQSLSKRFDQDRGVQQDFIGGTRAGSSREVFRTQQATSPELQQHAERFFNSAPAPPTQLVVPQPFNLAGLHDSLPQVQASVQLPQAQNPFASGWASDFLVQQVQAPISAVTHAEALQDRMQSPISAPMSPGLQGSMPWNASHAGYRMNPISGMMATVPMSMQRTALQTDHMSWDREFQSQETMMNAQVIPVAEAAASKPAPRDDMAELAARVIDAVHGEQNPKFHQSQFMSLMRQFRDGEVIVEEDKIVPSGSSTADVKGKGRALNIPVREVQEPVRVHSVPASSVQGYQGSVELNEAYRHQHNNANDAYFQQENEEFSKYWDAHYTGPVPHTKSAGEQGSWHELQRDWDAFEATSTGIKALINYQFQENNPYFLGDSSKTRHHAMHVSEVQRVYDNVLELEAAVQRDMNNAAAWYELGVKQQENEREMKAVQALERSVELDPTHLGAWLALSVSYTNDSNRMGVYNAIKEWALRNPKYKDIVQNATMTTTNVSSPGNFEALIECLISMARSADEMGGVDADVQVALAVLLNTTDEYAKAQDCFLTALAVRPDDWLLYNRVGATMANNGQAEEALQFYYRALDLNPAYIRARFNLGISCINLRRYEEAQSHILDALVLQDSDGVADDSGMNDKRGVTNSALWDSLKTTCLHLQRSDLAALCDQRDLDGFRNVFESGP
ncbi:hypothetical protein DEU56DRAFT_779216 [Suillus clintonianus]|uniref:uncharacterized protein n=1 Tax=Suillus clintonianus TaxID=1904413 RepID=UPI001B85B9CF|nr:uncharacterized protein DEU56DRAFT_779216 [Suillus clintonianus]KAG2150938.1 hypothetical protein DEU56DRAFT_779216 [Suillus clintonianus]